MANNTFVLGINGGVRPGYQDISAVLMLNGKIIAAVEEERINRVKHSAGQLPILSIKEVLRIAGIEIQQVSVVAFHGSTWQHSIETVLQMHFENYFGYCPEIKRYHHHNCHAASTFFPSGFNEALIVTVDGSGDGVSTQIALGKGNTIQILKRFDRPQSLGMFYSVFTQLCGFTRDADEYKLMGLAAYGNANSHNLNNILNIDEKGYMLDESCLAKITPGQPSPSRYEMLFSEELTAKMKTGRRTTREIQQVYKDIAASAQLQLEKALTSLIRNYIEETGIRKVCLAGGVALNCLANQKIELLPQVEELFIQPASSDAGISLGAAYLASIEQGVQSFEKQTHTFLGTEYDAAYVQHLLEKCNLSYQTNTQPEVHAAEQLANGKVIGWFQGKMEFGPRALGNRSILANPAVPGIQSTVNNKIKFREGFRPFGATVLEEDFHEFFEARCNEAPFMTKVFVVKEKYRTLLEGVTHFDGTCRVQTVNQKQNRLYYELLSTFKSKTGFGVLLNTSFNLSHEPIVNTPTEAIASFYASGLDVLYLSTCVIHKK